MPDLRNRFSAQRLRSALYFVALFLVLRFTGRGDPLEALETAIFPESNSFAAASVRLVPFHTKGGVAAPSEASHLLLFLHDRKEAEPISIYHSGSVGDLKDTGIGCLGGHLRGSQDNVLATDPVVASLEVPPRSLVALTAKTTADKASFTFSSTAGSRNFENPGDISFHTTNEMRELRLFYGALTAIFTLVGLTLPSFSTLMLPKLDRGEDAEANKA